VLADLKAYLDRMAQVIYHYHGQVDKYLGDGLLAIFTDPDEALQAGRAIQQAAAHFNRRQAARGGLIFPTRLAIDSGRVASTSLGSVERRERTVIGMAVNRAERLQAQATPGRVWLSQATFERLRDRSGCRCLGTVQLKGCAEPIIVYEKL
jgi:class 3 adenylate cyclase